jgi:hypothetical protein
VHMCRGTSEAWPGCLWRLVSESVVPHAARVCRQIEVPAAQRASACVHVRYTLAIYDSPLAQHLTQLRIQKIEIRTRYFLRLFHRLFKAVLQWPCGRPGGPKNPIAPVLAIWVLCLVSAWSLLGLCSPGVPDLARSFTFLGKRFRFGAKLP